MVATPWPCPMHIVARPSLAPWSRIRCKQRGRDPGAAGAQRMADRDRSAARVHLLFADAQQLEHGQDLDGERLVELDAIDLIEREPGSLQGLLSRREPARCPSPRD